MKAKSGDFEPFADAVASLSPHDHACLLYETREEQFAAAVPFIRRGLERHEQCVYIADDNSVEAVFAALGDGGVDVDSATRAGALRVITKGQAYVKPGYFDPEWMMSFWKLASDSATRAGFTALRATGEMTWALNGAPGIERLMEYEAKLNRFLAEHPASALCQYNTRRFPRELVRDAIQTHPTVISNGAVCKNPEYLPPDEFLARRAAEASGPSLARAVQQGTGGTPGRQVRVVTGEAQPPTEKTRPSGDSMVTGSSNDDLLEQMTSFVDGELPESVAADLERRIRENPEYQRLVAAERATKRVIRDRTTRYTAPAQFASRVRTALFDAPDAAKPQRARVWRLLTQSPAFATALGTVVLGIVMAVVLGLFGAGRITPYIEDVYAHHVKPDQFPIEFQGDYQTVAVQMAGAVGFKVPVPRLGDDFALLGARKCLLCGHRMAFVKYSGQEGSLSFFVLPKVRPAIARLEKRTREGTAFYTASHKAVQMAFWRDQGTTYCLAGSVGEDRLLALACEACCQARDEPVSAVARISTGLSDWLVAAIAH
jgi:anti-sigma factor RsiW